AVVDRAGGIGRPSHSKLSPANPNASRKRSANMIPGFSKPSITIGSDPNADIRLGGPGVAPSHATIVHQGGGVLMFIDNRAGQTLVNGQPMAPGSSAPFDFRTQFVVGQMPVPNVHPALALMLMSQGSAPVVPGQLTVGRDAQKAHLV